MTLQEFAPVFQRMALQVQHQFDADEVRAYHDALTDMPLDAVQASGATLGRAKGRRYMPTAGQWREAAMTERGLAWSRQQTGRADPWRIECDRCDDSGWLLPIACDGGTTCGRERAHLPHTFTKPCPCRPTNRTYQRTRRDGGAAA